MIHNDQTNIAVSHDLKDTPIDFRSKKDLSEWRGSITKFDGYTNTIPVEEKKDLSWDEIKNEICPPEPFLIDDKAQGPQFISCLLKEAPLIGKTLERAKKSGGKTVGKMRSGDHVTDSTLLTIEFDGVFREDFNDGLCKLEECGLTNKVFTTFSYGDIDVDKPGLYSRVILPMDRALGIEEYEQAYNGLNEYFFGGKADPSGAKLYQPQGTFFCHPDRASWSDSWEVTLGVASADALIQAGQLLKPIKANPVAQVNPGFSESDSEKQDKLSKLLGFIDPDIGYLDWLLVLIVIFNETKGSAEGLALADKWSSKGKKYKGANEIESKWRSFNLNQENPVTIATLCKIVQDNGGDLQAVLGVSGRKFEYHDRETAVIDVNSDSSNIAGRRTDKPEVVTVDQSVSTAIPDSNPLSSNDNEEIIAELAAMNPMDYDRVRTEKSKELNVQLKTLDTLVKKARNKESDTDNSPFAKTESWPESVVPGQLLDEMSGAIRCHAVLDSEQADSVALLITHTYLTDVSNTSSLGIINAPEKACGKSVLLKLIERMCFRPLSAANITASALFRSVDLWKPTLLFDEADTFLRDNKELHGMVNAGYEQGGFVIRSESVGDTFIPRKFSVYCPKFIAGIALEKHLPASTMSRGIIINMRRKRADEKVERLRNADTAKFDVIKSKLTRFAQDYAEQLRRARPSLPDELSDRDQDKWEPLLAIAECAGEQWLKRATEAALKLSCNGEASLSTGSQLLSDIQCIFDSNRYPGKISTTDLIEALCEDEEAPWATYNYGKPITPKQLANLLKSYGIKSKTVRQNDGRTPKGYDVEQFQDAFDRYIPDRKQ